jgi:hypothetical protein
MMVESTLAFDEIFYTSEPGVSKVKIELKTKKFHVLPFVLV